MRPDMVDGTWRLVWDLQTTLVIGLSCLYILVSGWLSLRYLRAAPDFPQKREMLWGARWGGPLLVGWFTLLFGVTWIAMVHSSYPLTLMLLPGVAAPIIGLLEFAFSGRLQGWGAWMTVLNRRQRGRTVDWEEIVAESDAKARKWWYRWLLPGVSVAVAGMFAFMALHCMLPLDRMMIDSRWEESAATEVKAWLADSPIEKVTVARHWPPRDLQGRPRVLPGDTIHRDHSRVWVRVAHGSSEQALKAIEKRVGKYLSDQGLEGYWVVRVYARDGASVGGRYTVSD